MTRKRSKIIMAILIFLLALSLIGILIFWLPKTSVDMAKLISSNPLTLTVRRIHWDPYPYLISIPIAFANVICAIKGLYSIYKERTSTPKRIIGYLIYMIISLGALVIHWLTFVFVIECIIAG